MILAEISISLAKDWVQVVFQSVSIIAICLGVFIGLYKFIQTRESLPKASLSATITSTMLTDGMVFLRVTATIENKGNRLLYLEQGFARLLQVKPCDAETMRQLSQDLSCADESKCTVKWPMIAKKKLPVDAPCEIEPYETDQVHFDFIVSDKVQVVCAWINIENVKKRKNALVWEYQTICDISASLRSSLSRDTFIDQTKGESNA